MNNPTSTTNSFLLQKEEMEILELLNLLEETTPMIPDSLMEFYMNKAGVQCEDVRLKRLVALIGQKFITDIANDSMHFHRLRQGSSGLPSAPISTSPHPSSATAAAGSASKKTILTLEDLAPALQEYGINIKKPSYYT